MMLDDPVRQTLVPSFATWHNTLHPLHELGTICLWP